MGPLMWWWRWWLGGDPNRQLSDAAVLLEQRDDELTSLIEEREREIERLRGVVADLQRARDEADRARSQAEKARAHLTSEADQARAETDEARAETDQARAETDSLRAQVDELTARLEADAAAREAATDRGSDTAADQPAADVDEEHAPPPQPAAAPAPDVAAGSEVLGRPVTLDDLTVLEGVGPKIAGVLADAGFDTWRALADADAARLREVLVDANPLYRMHDPSGWPAQAALLAEGRWGEFKQLTTR